MEPCAGDWLRSVKAQQYINLNSSVPHLKLNLPTYQGEKGSKTKAKAIILKSFFLLIYLQTKNVMYKINQ